MRISDWSSDVCSSDLDGTLLETVVSAGDTVPVGDVIGYWDDGLGESAAPVQETKEQAPADLGVGEPAADTAALAQQKTDSTHPDPGEQQAPDGSQRLISTPYARTLAAGQGVYLSGLSGTGTDRQRVGEGKRVTIRE